MTYLSRQLSSNGFLSSKKALLVGFCMYVALLTAEALLATYQLRANWNGLSLVLKTSLLSLQIIFSATKLVTARRILYVCRCQELGISKEPKSPPLKTD